MERLADGSFYDPSILRSKKPGERLEAGVRAHEFIARTVEENSVRLEDFLQKKLWIAFYRYSGCPLCASHFDEVVSRIIDLRANNVVFMAVFDSPSEKIIPRIRKQASPDVIIVGNDNLGLFETFGVEKSLFKTLSLGSVKALKDANSQGYTMEQVSKDGLTRIPAHILINPGGEVVQAHYGKHAGDHINWRTAWEFVQRKPESSTGLSLVD